MNDMGIYRQLTAGIEFFPAFMTERLPASRFPDDAGVYFCDGCERDITRHLRRERAHVRQSIGPMRYTCDCGKSYLTGATEWDYLSEWDKRQWRSDVGLGVILLILLMIPIALGFATWHRQSVVLLGVLISVLIPSLLFLKLFGQALIEVLDIARSIWRTRFRRKVLND
jgi:hypothetical protein